MKIRAEIGLAIIVILISQISLATVEPKIEVCQLVAEASSCVLAYEQAKSVVMSSCYGVAPKCDGRGSDSVYEWTYSPVFRVKDVPREEKTADRCYIEVILEKTCQKNVRCKNPQFCPF